jgi:hypothetical protein
MLGFERDERDHHCFILKVNGKLVARTKTSHGSKAHDIDDTLLGKIARMQLHVARLFSRRCLRARRHVKTISRSCNAKGRSSRRLRWHQKATALDATAGSVLFLKTAPAVI